MNYAQIRDMDIVNGEGIAVSLFVSGCPHHCKGCFNPETWDYNYGQTWTQEVEDKFIELCKRDYVTCVSLLGGEPLAQRDDILELLQRIKSEVDKPIYVWTGFTAEYIERNPSLALNLFYIDYLIDGKFEEDKKDVRLRLRGSSNQRIWHVIHDGKFNHLFDVTEEKGWRRK
jgi:anaerobic ribonucleoside-triphosphate reductase activating protein